MSELKPCPFCGGEAVLEPYAVRKGFEATIHCNGGCFASQKTITYDTEQDAIIEVTKAWNKRVENPNPIIAGLEKRLQQKDDMLQVANERIAELEKDNDEYKNRLSLVYDFYE